MQKQLKTMAKDVSEASSFANKKLLEETQKFVAENHKYNYATDFEKAHPKSNSELVAEYLIIKGYCKASDITKLIFDDIAKKLMRLKPTPEYVAIKATDLIEIYDKYKENDND